MLYFKLNGAGEVVDIVEKYPGGYDPSYVCRWENKSFEDAEKLAASATKFSGDLYIATDAGPSVSPRYDVIKAPKVGDKVSYGFNGDYYPDGEIVSISKTMKKITTSSGKSYYRHKLSGGWYNNGTWGLVMGVRDERNPCF